MPQPANTTSTKRGRRGFLRKPTTTTMSLEEDLLEQVQKRAFAGGESVSQWMADAAQQKLKRSGRSK